MSYANDRIESARRRALDLTWNTEIEVYAPTETYSPGDGYSVSRPDPETDDPDAVYEAHAMEPRPQSETERSGTDADVDRRIMVRDDIGQTWTDYGESGEAAVQIRETETGIVYTVETVVDRHDGRERLGCTEV